MTVDRILEQLKGVKRGGSGWIARCPHHDDKNPSLSVSYDGIKGRTLLHCHGGCNIEAVTAAIGLKTGDLYDEPLENQRWTEREALDHLLAVRGLTLATVALFNITPDEEKQAWQYPLSRPGEGHRYKAFPVKGIKGDTKLKYWFSQGAKNSVYNLHYLPEGVAAYMVEGETDVWTLSQAGLDAFSFGGAATRNMNFIEQVKAKEFQEVRIVFDNDEAGRKGAIAARDLMRQRGVNAKAYRLPTWMPIPSDVTTLYNHDKEAFIRNMTDLSQIYTKGEIIRFVRDELNDINMLHTSPGGSTDFEVECSGNYDRLEQLENMLTDLIDKGAVV